MLTDGPTNLPQGPPVPGSLPTRVRAASGGFTLMEVLVAVTILGVGFVALFGVLSGSLRTVSRIGDREDAGPHRPDEDEPDLPGAPPGPGAGRPLGGVRRQVPLAGRDRSGRRRRKGRTPAGLPAGPGPAAGRLAGKPGREPLSSGDHDMGSHPTRAMTKPSAKIVHEGIKEISTKDHEGRRRTTKRDGSASTARAAALRLGVPPPPTASAFACGSASATPPQGGSDTWSALCKASSITPPLRGSRREGGARSRAGGGQTRRPVEPEGGKRGVPSSRRGANAASRK